MICLQLLRGNSAGQVIKASRFPFFIGRSAESSLRLEEVGVSAKHAQLLCEPDGYYIEPLDGAGVYLNQTSVQRTRLRQGDVIDLGVVRLKFWLSPVRQPGLVMSEAVTWTLLGLSIAAELWLIFKVLA